MEAKSPQAIETACAGLFLLLRAVLDSRLPGLAERAGWPPGLAGEDSSGAPPRLRAVLSAFGLAWGGEAALDGSGSLDPGLAFLAGWTEPPAAEDVTAFWRSSTREDHGRFQAALLATLAGHRLLSGDALFLHRIGLPSDGEALVGGSGDGLWPLGRILPLETGAAGLADEWRALWETATGSIPGVIGPEPPPEDDPAGADHHRDRVELERTLAGLALPIRLAADGGADLAVALAAAALLRLWGRWLQGFSASSAPYLADSFIRRPGSLRMDGDAVTVTLEPRPLDMVLQMAGYSAETGRVPWLGDRRVRFRFGGQT